MSLRDSFENAGKDNIENGIYVLALYGGQKFDGMMQRANSIPEVSSGLGSAVQQAPNRRSFGGTGAYSGRPFDPSNAGGPIRHLTTDRIKITNRGIDVVEQHLSRSDTYAPNQQMLGRLRRIARGELTPTQTDLNFYAHELREYARYRNLGWQSGVPDNLDARHTLWENAHTATLEDYRLREGPGVLYVP